MNAPVTMFLALLLVQAAGSPNWTYRFEAVSSKVVLTHEGKDERATVGMSAAPGDRVATGWFGKTIIGVPEQACHFEVFSATTVRLAGAEPGILVVVDKGRVRAIFDALTGDHDRLVATPGAILAVRGTRYGLEVDEKGNALLAVFDGTVEVRSIIINTPLVLVKPGGLCQYGPRSIPRQMPMPPGMTEKSWGRDGAMGPMRGPETRGPGSMMGPGAGGNQGSPKGMMGGKH